MSRAGYNVIEEITRNSEQSVTRGKQPPLDVLSAILPDIRPAKELYQH